LLLLVDLVGFMGSGLLRPHHIRDPGIKAAPLGPPSRTALFRDHPETGD
jgi:hypothetical protein